jgi:hypothetical protein
MMVRACDFAMILLRDEKDLVRGFFQPSHAPGPRYGASLHYAP